MTNFADWWENIFNGLTGFTIIFVVAIVSLLIIYRAIKKVSPSTTSQTKRPPAIQKVDRSGAPLHNPFIHGNPVEPEQLIGRDRELRRIVGRIITGQSTIITGSQRSGKTSMLQGLIVKPNEKRAKTLYGDEVNQLIFSYLDAFKATEFDRIQFWQSVLKPLQERIIDQETDTALSQAYQSCQDNQFQTDELENLIDQINQVGWRLVLLIDEFDKLLDNPILTKNQGQFFASLRALLVSPNNQGGLVLVITSALSRSQLDNQAPKTSNGSPYFNIMDEIVLGALPEAKVDDELLDQGKAYFTDEDCRFIKDIAGGHPYFLQVAASILWESYEDGNKDERQRMKDVFYSKVEETLTDIWNAWDKEKQNTFTSVALIHAEKINYPIEWLDNKNIAENPSNPQLLIELGKYGVLRKDDEMGNGWRVSSSVFFDFIHHNPKILKDLEKSTSDEDEPPNTGDNSQKNLGSEKDETQPKRRTFLRRITAILLVISTLIWTLIKFEEIAIFACKYIPKFGESESCELLEQGIKESYKLEDSPENRTQGK
ncbi:MAG: ATP-binding protein [Candidatus Parabeggiatoa sp.]|nr:ATP-binding protein [Candidatus Parabeggiatoa sp.]